MRDYEPHELDSRLLQRSGSGGRSRLRGVFVRRLRRSPSRSSSKAPPASIASTLKPYFTGTDPAAVQRGVDDLKATGIYSSVSARVVDGKIVVIARHRAQQIINRVAFEGNRNIQKDQLEVEVQSKPRAAYNEATAEADIGRIKDAYKKYGRNAASVTKRLVQLPNGRVDLVFTIDEGDKTGIREIHFVGNHAVSNYRLHNLMQTSTMFLSCRGSRAPTSTIPTGSPPTRRRSAATT